MPNKFFNVNDREQIVTIVEDKDKFYKLSDGSMIKKDTFMHKYQPVLEDIVESVDNTPKNIVNSTDTINPEDFFNVKSVPDEVIQGVKQADPTKGIGEGSVNRTEVKRKVPGQMDKVSPMDNSLVKQINENEQVIPNHTNTDVSQYKVYENDEEAYEDFLKKNGTTNPQQPKPQKSDIEKKKMEIEYLFDDEKMALGEEEAISRRNKRLLKLPNITETTTEVNQTDSIVTNTPTDTTAPQTQQLSAIEMMFSTFKRKHPITINVSFEDKIGEPDFVKLMVENMDGDIVGYYKGLVMNNIMKDLSKIEEAVEREIQMEIFGEIKEEEKSTEIVLIPGGLTKSGKQKYKYIDLNGNVKELLPNTAKTKGYEPYQEKE